MDVGRNIHRSRKRQGLTLDVLARGSGVSRAMLSDVERGNRSPTIKILSQIAVGLGLTVSELLAEAAPDALHIERADQHPVVFDEASGVQRTTLASPWLRRGLELVWYTLPGGACMRRSPEAVWYSANGGSRSGPFPPNPHGTLEHIAVVAGRATLRVGEVETLLRAGDAVSYRLVDEVRLDNGAKTPCRLSLLIDTGERP